MLMKVLVRWAPAVLLMTFLFVSSSLPGATVSEVKLYDALAHKAVHVLLYFLLTTAMYKGTKNIELAVVLAVFYGVTDEIHQQFTPTRSGNIYDVGVDAFAAVLAGVVLWKFYHLLPTKLKNWLAE